jgi:hypothetical protein
MTDFRRFDIDAKEWGQFKVLRPIVRDGEDPWGDLAPLKDTPVGSLIPVISGESFSHALHGYLAPLLREIGPEPKALLRLVPEPMQECLQAGACIMYQENACRLNPKVPGCHVPAGFSPSAASLAAIVLLAWAEGRYVVVVEGPEFSL